MAEENYSEWERVCELIWGCAIGQAIHVFVELGIPELLDSGAKSADQLAATTGADAWTLETVLRALAAFEVVSVQGKQYALTHMGGLLLKRGLGTSAGEAGEFFETIYRSLGALMYMIKTGNVAFDHVYGKTFYDYLAECPTLAAHFYDTMEANAPERYVGLSSVCDLSPFSLVIDVGGGEGSLLVQILQENADMKGILFDLPIVSDRAKARIAAAGLSDRCKIACGDYQKSVPRGGDLYILAQILNNWRDKDALRILENCRVAMDHDARLLILEPIYSPGLSRWRALVSLGVVAQRGGRSRSERQLRTMIAKAGYHIEDVLRLPSRETYAIKAKPIR
jgi:hypothetical protein